jgi:hypothetical protein
LYFVVEASLLFAISDPEIFPLTRNKIEKLGFNPIGEVFIHEREMSRRLALEILSCFVPESIVNAGGEGIN